MVVLSLFGNLSDGDCTLWAVLQAAEALSTVGADLCLALNDGDVASWAQSHALTTADTFVADRKGGCFFLYHLGKSHVFKGVENIESWLATCFSIDNIFCNLSGQVFVSGFSLSDGEPWHHHVVWEQPYAAAMMCDNAPIF